MSREKKRHPCVSCDTFVALPPTTANGCVVFGKNSDRPDNEVQEVVYCAAADHAAGTKLECTYIEIPQVSHTYAVILSKPAWMWGAEMGANEHGVCIGNEAVYTKEEGPQDKDEKLLGMDLLRLGLERGKTSREALDVIGSLLVEYGQGGACSDDSGLGSWTYHNSFLLADGSEAWVMETAGNHWAAEKITSGIRNISSLLTIGTKIHAMSPGLKEHAQSKGWWNPDEGDFNFAKVFDEPLPKRGSGQASRYYSGWDLMEKGAENDEFRVTNMFDVLGDEPSGINFVGPYGFVSMGSQASVLPPPGSGKPACHWFTATPNPACSVFKPFIFCPDVVFTPLTQSPAFKDDPAKANPRFRKRVDRRHPLFKAHQQVHPLPGDECDSAVLKKMKDLEASNVLIVEEFLASYSESRASELGDIFTKVAASEMELYPE